VRDAVEFKDLREEYETNGIDESELLGPSYPGHPIVVRRNRRELPDQWYDPNAMTLST